MPIVYEASGEARIVPGGGGSRPARIAKEIYKLALKLKAKGVTDFEDPFSPASFDKPASAFITLPVARLHLDLHGRNSNGTLKKSSQKAAIVDSSEADPTSFAQRLDYNFLRARAEEAAALAAMQAAATAERERQQHSPRHSHFSPHYARASGGASGHFSHRSSGGDPTQACAEIEEMSARISSAAFSAQAILVHDEDPYGDLEAERRALRGEDSVDRASPGRRTPCLSRMWPMVAGAPPSGSQALALPLPRMEVSPVKRRGDREVGQQSLRWDSLPGEGSQGVQEEQSSQSIQAETSSSSAAS